jgi:cell division protein ZapA
MSAKKTVVRVQILGEEHAIRSDASLEHTRAVAEYVDQAIRRVQSSGAVIETHKAAILAALQITDELFKAREASDEVAERVRAMSGEVKRMLPPAKRG